jgi:hypothetical protein
VASNVVTEATGANIPDATLHGYVAEGARTNLALNSASLGNVTGYLDLTSTGVTVTPNSTVAPDGTLTADTVTRIVGSGDKRLQQNTGGIANDNATYTFSLFILKSSDGIVSRVSALLTNGASVTSTVTFNTQTGAVTSSSGTYLIQDWNPLWWRVSVTVTNNSSGNTVLAQTFYPDNSGNNSAGSKVAWGAQLEAGAFASSYIPTTTASVTRNADVLTYPSAGNYSGTSLTWYSEARINHSVNTYGPILSIDDGTANNRIDGGLSGVGQQFWLGSVISGGTTYWSTGNGLVVSSNINKVGATIAQTNAKAYANGTQEGQTSTNVIFPISPTRITVGNDGYGRKLYGTIRNVKIWKKALTDTQLTNMTSSDPDVSASAIQQTVVNDSQNTKLTSGLVGLWSFDGLDAIGTAMYDRSGQGHNGILTNGPTKTIGRVIQAISFDGIDDSIVIGTGYNGVKTISFWVKPNTTTQSIIDFNGTQTVDISAGTVRGNSFTSPTIYIDGTATATFPDTDWHFVTITTGTGINASAFNIGKIASTYLNGSIDEVRLYSRVLSASEISGLYNLGR